jgi:formate hydrogenlyase transcriptional activator
VICHALGLSTLVAAQARPPLLFVGNRDYAPLSSIADGVPTGMDVDMARAIGQVMGRDVRVELMEWAEARDRVLHGDADGLIDLGTSTERRELWDFTEPLVTHEFALFVRDDEVAIRGVRDLTGRRVGVTTGGFPAEFLQAHSAVTLVSIAGYDDGFDRLTSGALDAVAADTWVAAYTIQQRGLRNIVIAGEPFVTMPAGIAVRKGNTALASEISRAVRTLKANGELARIQEAWRPQEIVFLSRERIQRVTVLVLGAFLGLIAAGMAAWILTLKRQIAGRKRQQEALRASEEKFAKAFESSPDAIVLIDVEAGVLDVNERFEAITGYTRQEVLGRRLVDVGMVGADVRAQVLGQLQQRGLARDVSFTLQCKDGSRKEIVMSGEPIEIGGRPCFLTVARDVTEQKRLEAHLRRASEINELLVSELEPEALYASITQSLNAVIRLDYAGLVLFDPGSDDLRIEAQTFFDGRGIVASRQQVDAGTAPARAALDLGRITVFGRTELDAFGPTVAPLVEEGLQALCAVPLHARRGGALGTLLVGRRGSEAFTADDLAVLQQIATYVAIAIDNARTHDEVTTLKNQLAQEKLYLEEEIRDNQDFTDIVGSSPALKRVLHQIQTVAPTDSTVLLLGETGTGKELLARALHDLSPRRNHTFVRVNAAALPATLLESELFGHERGAFTGAVAAKVGRFELAHRGTLFLDEVGDIPLEIQPKLLRLLQEKTFERLGSTRTQRADVRLIAATNRDLEGMIRAGTYRSDLYYRLNVFPVRVPPLRERPEDIPMLVRHFATRFASRLGREVSTIPASSMSALQRWHWPGNIRELENVIERAVVVSGGPVLQVSLPEAGAPPLPLSPMPMSRPAPVSDAAAPSRSSASYAEGERSLILDALRESGGTVASAAARLGLKRTTLQSKMRKLGIVRPSF